jgi:Cu/Ag efflux pump CusA
LHEIRDRSRELPGMMVSVGQPISHRLDHMLSGVQAAIAVKIYGPDLAMLRRYAATAEAVMRAVPGVVDLQVEKQVLIPQVKIQVNRERAALHGLQPGELAARLGSRLERPRRRPGARGHAHARSGGALSRMRRAPIPTACASCCVDTPSGGRVPLAMIADVLESQGPNAISREDAMRRIVISANTAERDLGSIVAHIQRELPRKCPWSAAISSATKASSRARNRRRGSSDSFRC